jgi:hypothetical protein
MDDNQKKFIPPLTIGTKFFHRYTPILYDVIPKAQSELCLCAPYCDLAIECLMANYCIRWHGIFKGLSQDEGRADFSKKTQSVSL